MRSPSLELFQLIGSLSPTEKRYFRLFADQHVLKGQNNYLRLFDAIERQVRKGEYDEEFLLKKFKGDNLGKYFASVKYQLYKLILKSMRQFHSGDTIDAELGEALQNVRFLREKRLHQQALKVLNNAKKKAEKHERFTILLDINLLEVEVLKDIYDPVQLVRILEVNHAQMQNYTSKYRNYANYKFLYNKASMMYRSRGAARSFEDFDAFSQLLNQPLMRQVDNAKSQSATYFYHFTRVVGEFALGEMEECYKLTRFLVEMLELYPFELQSDVNQYIDILYHHLMVCHALKYDEEFLKFLAVLKEVKAKTKSQQAKAFECYYTLYFDFVLEHPEEEEPDELIELFGEQLEGHIEHLNKEIELVLYSQATRLYMINGNYSRALRWNNRLLNMSRPNLREDIQSLARIFDLLIHFELTHFDLLEYRIKSAYRFLSKKKKLYEIEDLLLKSLRKFALIPTKRELIILFHNLRRGLVELADDPLEGRVLELFDFVAWLDAKLDRLS